MKFIPKLFNTEMVIALLNGTKNQTRRTKGLEKVNRNPDNFVVKQISNLFYFTNKFTEKTFLINPPANVGDVLWVRETFTVIKSIETGLSYVVAKVGFESYKDKIIQDDKIKWKPSIFMPKQACRLFLEVTEVTVERLNDISESDAINEGIERIKEDGMLAFRSYAVKYDACVFPYVSYQTLWQKINGVNSWNENPWVWVIKFKKIDKPSNFL